MTLLPPQGSVTGTVRNADGSPAVGATVSALLFFPSINLTGTWSFTTTDATGAYALLDLPVGTLLGGEVGGPYTLVANLNQTRSPSQSINLAANQSLVKDLQLGGFGTVNVTVTTPTGTPVSGASVSIVNLAASTTDGTGQATFTNVPANLPLTINATDPAFNWISAIATATVTTGSTITVPIALPATGSVTGRVTLPSGAPAAGVSVSVNSSNSTRPFFGFAVTADSSGVYTAQPVPINRLFSVSAQSSTRSVFVDSQTIPTANASLTVDLALPAQATARVTVKNGSSPVLNSYVEIQPPGSTFFTNRTRVDGSGSATFSVGPGVTLLRADDPTNFFHIIGQSSVTVNPADDGTTLNITINTGLSGTVQGTVFAGDGATPIPFAQVDILDNATGLSVIPCGDFCGGLGSDENGFFKRDNVIVGNLGFRVVATQGSTSVGQNGSFTSDGQIVTVNLTLPVSAIKGTVFRSDGATSVAFPTIFAVQGDNSYFSSSDQNGRFTIIGVPLGSFNLKAFSSLLSGTVAGTVTSVSTPVALNVLLEPSSSFSGQVLDSSGAPLPFAEVGALAREFNQAATADATGNYQFTDLPLGPALVQAQDPATNVSNTASVTLTAGLPPVVNLRLPQTGSVAGQATDLAAAPAANADVSVESFSSTGPLGTFRGFTAADGAGNYVAPGVPVGGVRVTAGDPLNTNTVGFADGTLVAPGPLALNVQYGNGIRLGIANLDGADGFRYDVACWGDLSDGGTVDRRLTHAYLGAFFANFEGPLSADLLSCRTTAGLELNGRQIVISPSQTNGLIATRKVFVPPSGRYARYLEILTNPTGATVSGDLKITGTLGSFNGTHLVVDPATSLNRYSVTDASGACCYPTLGFVFAGSNPPVAASNVSFVDSFGSFSYGWHVTIPAGQTVILMHFAAQRDLSDSAGATAIVQALSGLSDSEELTGLTAAEKAEIANFRIP